jgi:hypothetical protein
MAILAAFVTPHASAGCLDVRTATVSRFPTAAPFVRSLTFATVDSYRPLAVDTRDDAPIVGLWKIQFLSKGNPGIDDGTVLDDGYATWHSDGTELMNSSRPPMTGNFCMGVWKQTGRSTFTLNHFALSWDKTGTTFVGPTNIREVVTVDPSHDAYRGTFTITQYDVDGETALGGPAGIVVGTRIKP